MTLKNRIVMPPMDVGVGYRGWRARGFYGERARGGVGAIMPAALSVDLLSTDDAWEQGGGVASFIEGLRLLTDEVHKAEAKIGLQLFYPPRFPAYTGSPEDTRGDLVGPSARIEPDPPVHAYASALAEVRELTIEEIETIISRFAKGAAAAKEAGFDFVEFHGAHGYLPCQFFSPLDNRRTDKYGGDLPRRMRFGLECVKAIRATVGDNYPIFYRIGAVEDRPGGISLDDSIEFAIELEKAGVDVIDVSIASNPELKYFTWPNIAIPTSDFPMGTFAHLAEAIKQWVSVPVITVGRINTPEVAESILTQDKADLVAIGRQLIADPFWPDKAVKGEFDEIVPCLSCNTCLETGRRERRASCAVNASVGKEAEYRIIPAEKTKKVLVAGGGPAGMEAARVAALRGHEVTLCEKNVQLGGKLLVAGIAPYKDRINELREYLIRQIEKTGIEVKLSNEVTAKFIEEIKPDVVIIATGAIPLIPDIPGIRGDNVVTALDILSNRKEVGDKVIIVGGGMVGCETAEFLAQKGKKVIIIEMLEEIGSDIELITRFRILQRLSNGGVRMKTRTEVEEITDRGIRAAREGRTEFFEADTVVLATGMKSINEFAKELEGKIAELYLIGDCTEPRKIVNAIGDGARIGREI